MSDLPAPLLHPSKLRLLSIAVKELGPQQLFQFALYRLGLRSGYFKWATHRPRSHTSAKARHALAQVYSPPQKERLVEILGDEGLQLALDEAELAALGRMHLFGGEELEIRLQPPEPLLHWTEYESKGMAAPGLDIKYIWEPARLGWAYSLGRGYVLSGDERFPAAFYEFLECFLEANPPYLGWNWVSAQEAGLRVLAMTFAWHVFRQSIHSTPERADLLAQAVAVHASRIPPTLAYARAQNNNHLLSEAVGLYTAGLMLPNHPKARTWRETGWRCFHNSIQAQISEDGAYIQNSANYQRLMLQLALWMRHLAAKAGHSFPAKSTARLQAAASWLLALLDQKSGGVPNLGPNDGAYLFPFAALPHEDYRPVLQAAASEFLHKRILGRGPWDEMQAWLGIEDLAYQQNGNSAKNKPLEFDTAVKSVPKGTPHTLSSDQGESWAYLRVAHFSGRPGHADQLHLDLWWRGINIARDAGTYLYNAPPPWDNALAGSDVHNTVTVDGLDQMQRIGRFLYLNWAQAQVCSVNLNAADGSRQITAGHDGYRRVGVIHQRKAAAFPGDQWLIEDTLLPYPGSAPMSAPHRACLTWLLPDWPWEVEESEAQIRLRLSSPQGPVELRASKGEKSENLVPNEIQIVRAGELVYGIEPVKPTWGWFSPTYGQKMPALSVRITLRGPLPLQIRSEWRLGDGPSHD